MLIIFSFYILLLNSYYHSIFKYLNVLLWNIEQVLNVPKNLSVRDKVNKKREDAFDEEEQKYLYLPPFFIQFLN